MADESYHEDQLETVLTVIFVGIGGLLAALAYVLFGSRIRHRLHKDSPGARTA